MAKELNLTSGRKSGEDKRRTQPKDVGPPSPAEVAALYKKDRVHSSLNDRDGDGLSTKEQHAREVKSQKPQDPMDQHDNGLGRYDNDVADGWLRGSGLKAAEAKPFFDSYSNKAVLRERTTDPKAGLNGSRPERSAVKAPGPAKGGKPNTASGQDCKSSPFSSAYRKGAGEGF